MAGLGVGFLLLCVTPSLAQSDEEFLTAAIETNLAEIQMGELAADKGSVQEVKDFGNTLVEDHTAANEEATALASSMGVTPPTEPNAEQKQAYEEVSGLSGEEFDAAFAKHMVMGHEKAVEMFRTKSEEGDNDVSAFAKKTLPVLEKHLETAKSLSGSSG
jgi:putative membrane protein